MPQDPLYRLDIAPLTPLPLTRSPLFSYRHNEALPLGTLVQVPFGRRSLRGIVVTAEVLPGRAPLWLKPIERVIYRAWLNAYQLAIAQSIGERYLSSLGNTLKHFVFPLPKKITAQLIEKPSQTKLTRKKAPKALYIEAKTDTELHTLLEQKIKAGLKRSGSLLILGPDLLLTTLLKHKLEALAPEKTVLLTSQLTGKQLCETWEKIRSGQAKIIFGTRQALFAPLTKLRDIIVLFPEERLSYKQWDMTPHYEAEWVATKWARQTGATLTYLTTALGLTHWQHFPRALHPHLNAPTIINRRMDGKGARARVLAKELEKTLKSLPVGSKVLSIAKERGVAGVLICQHCRTVARCPNCEHLLGEAASGHFRCSKCQYESPLFPKCRACSHMTFKSFGFGTVRVERELESLLPTLRILRLDRDTLASRSAWKTVVTKLERADFDILITTQEIGTLLPLPPFDLIVMLEGDHSLTFAHFDSEERLFLQVKRLTAKLKPDGKLMVQTFAPEERVWCMSLVGNTKAYMEELLDERKLLGYPPVTAMIHIVPGKGVVLTSREREQLRKRLEEVLKIFSGFTVSPFFEKKTGGQGINHHLLIKYPAETPLPDILMTFLKRESQHLHIDIHPFHT